MTSLSKSPKAFKTKDKMDHIEYIRFLPTVHLKVLKNTAAAKKLGYCYKSSSKNISFLQADVFGT
jgi:hypothetical protein